MFFFFFFKQKTAYEMRISDWSSDVCSSDLVEGYEIEWANISGGPKSIEAFRADALDASYVAEIPPLFATWTDTPVKIVAVTENPDPLDNPIYELGRSEERRVGKECFRTCRSRWST